MSDVLGLHEESIGFNVHFTSLLLLYYSLNLLEIVWNEYTCSVYIYMYMRTQLYSPETMKELHYRKLHIQPKLRFWNQLIPRPKSIKMPWSIYENWSNSIAWSLQLRKKSLTGIEFTTQKSAKKQTLVTWAKIANQKLLITWDGLVDDFCTFHYLRFSYSKWWREPDDVTMGRLS